MTSQFMSGHPSLFGPQGTFPHMYSQEGLPDLKNEKYLASLFFYLGRTPLLSTHHYLYLGVPVHRAQTSAWGLSISYLKKTDKEKNKQKFVNIHSSGTYGNTQ